MACENIEQILITESNRIGPDIYRRTLNTSPWTTLVKQEAWPDEMGEAVRVLVYERTLPGTGAPLTFTDVLNSDGEASGTCAPEGAALGFAQTLTSYNLQQAAINSPDICLNDLRFPVKRQEQLRNIMAVLTENTQYAWENRYRGEYVRLAGNKIVATQADITASTHGNDNVFAAGPADSRLTQGILRYFYSKLIRDGAATNAYGRENGAPVFLLITSPETSDEIIKLNADIRQDFRYAKPSELLAPLGVERSYAGFYHLIDTMTPRYNWNSVANAWDPVYPYTTAAATKGTKFVPNPAYYTATHEDSIIFHPDVFTSLVPKPIGATGQMAFDPQSYRGDFRWRNIPDRVCNPDGNIGFFRAIFSSGSKPVFKNLGYVIRHLRCAEDLSLLSCPE